MEARIDLLVVNGKYKDIWKNNLVNYFRSRQIFEGVETEFFKISTLLHN